MNLFVDENKFPGKQIAGSFPSKSQSTSFNLYKDIQRLKPGLCNSLWNADRPKSPNVPPILLVSISKRTLPPLVEEFSTQKRHVLNNTLEFDRLKKPEHAISIDYPPFSISCFPKKTDLITSIKPSINSFLFSRKHSTHQHIKVRF